MSNVEHYHETLINMMEQYRINAKVFVKVAQLTSNKLQLTCILGTLWITLMEVELIYIQE
jgi:hypothetical protein